MPTANPRHYSRVTLWLAALLFAAPWAQGKCPVCKHACVANDCGLLVVERLAQMRHISKVCNVDLQVNQAVLIAH